MAITLPVNRSPQAANGLSCVRPPCRAFGRAVSVVLTPVCALFRAAKMVCTHPLETFDQGFQKSFTTAGNALLGASNAMGKTIDRAVVAMEKTTAAGETLITVTNRARRRVAQAVGANTPSANKLLGACALASSLVIAGVSGLSTAALFAAPYALLTATIGSVIFAALTYTRAYSPEITLIARDQNEHLEQLKTEERYLRQQRDRVMPMHAQGTVFPLSIASSLTALACCAGAVSPVFAAGMLLGYASGAAASGSIERLFINGRLNDLNTTVEARKNW